MKAFLDTSVLVPVFLGDHVHHEASLKLFVSLNKSKGCCGAHSLAEVYSTLTRMPGRPRISAVQALLFIGSVREHLSIISLDGDEYTAALSASAGLGIVGGGIYDAMLAHCALKADAITIYSWNIRHYSLCGEPITRRLRTPLRHPRRIQAVAEPRHRRHRRAVSRRANPMCRFSVRSLLRPVEGCSL